eukprot:SM000452S16094  [mRNA]  locus=s452:20532:23694:- [translate_table: standard]
MQQAGGFSFGFPPAHFGHPTFGSPAAHMGAPPRQGPAAASSAPHSRGFTSLHQQQQPPPQHHEPHAPPWPSQRQQGESPKQQLQQLGRPEMDGDGGEREKERDRREGPAAVEKVVSSIHQRGIQSPSAPDGGGGGTGSTPMPPSTSGKSMGRGPGPLGLPPVAAMMAPQGHAMLQGAGSSSTSEGPSTGNRRPPEEGGGSGGSGGGGGGGGSNRSHREADVNHHRMAVIKPPRQERNGTQSTAASRGSPGSLATRDRAEADGHVVGGGAAAGVKGMASLSAASTLAPGSVPSLTTRALLTGEGMGRGAALPSLPQSTVASSKAMPATSHSSAALSVTAPGTPQHQKQSAARGAKPVSAAGSAPGGPASPSEGPARPGSLGSSPLGQLPPLRLTPGPTPPTLAGAQAVLAAAMSNAGKQAQHRSLPIGNAPAALLKQFTAGHGPHLAPAVGKASKGPLKLPPTAAAKKGLHALPHQPQGHLPVPPQALTSGPASTGSAMRGMQRVQNGTGAPPSGALGRGSVSGSTALPDLKPGRGSLSAHILSATPLPQSLASATPPKGAPSSPAPASISQRSLVHPLYRSPGQMAASPTTPPVGTSPSPAGAAASGAKAVQPAAAEASGAKSLKEADADQASLLGQRSTSAHSDSEMSSAVAPPSTSSAVGLASQVQAGPSPPSSNPAKTPHSTPQPGTQHQSTSAATSAPHLESSGPVSGSSIPLSVQAPTPPQKVAKNNVDKDHVMGSRPMDVAPSPPPKAAGGGVHGEEAASLTLGPVVN